MKKEKKWDYELLSELSKLMKPNKPEEYHNRENIMRNRNCPARIIQRTVKDMYQKQELK